jgi:DNA-binding transcriptional MerR regulator
METGTRGKTYKIGQAAKLLDVKPFVLRFWESEFKDVLVPVRTPAGQRAYSERNVDTVREIKRLLYDEGLTIEGAKKRLGQPLGSAAQPGAAHAGVAAAAESGSLASSPDATPPHCARSGPKAETLRDALRSVESELTRIRDLLGN